MQAIMETIFEVIYLGFAVFSGVFILIKKRGNTSYILLALAILLLGIGDAFHLIPRMIAINTTGLDNYKVALNNTEVRYIHSIELKYAVGKK